MNNGQKTLIAVVVVVVVLLLGVGAYFFADYSERQNQLNTLGLCFRMGPN